MKKLLTLTAAFAVVLLAGCVNTNPTDEEIMEPVAEVVVADVVVPEVLVEDVIIDEIPADEVAAE